MLSMLTGKKKVGIIGFGNMGQAIAERIKSKYIVYVFDKDKNKISGVTDIRISDSAKDLAGSTDTIILAVKPQDFDIVLDEIKDSAKDRLIISIAAGITSDYIKKYLGGVRVIRVMPNMPAKIGRGMTCLSKGQYASSIDLRFAQELFRLVGKTLILEEAMLDAATAISGSGPGYYFDIVESSQEDYKRNRRRILQEFIVSLKQAAEAIGFNPKEAFLLAKTTAEASDILLAKSNLPAQELKKQITSKGGTTEAGLEAFHRRGSLTEAARAALIRARELSKKG